MNTTLIKLSLVKENKEDIILQSFVDEVVALNKDKVEYWLEEVNADSQYIIESFISSILAEVMVTKTHEQVIDYIGSGRLFRLKNMLEDEFLKLL